MALPDIRPIVSLFKRLGRALERLVLGVLDNPGEPMTDLDEAEQIATEAARETREALVEWVEGEAGSFYDDAVTENGGTLDSLSVEAEAAKNLQLEELASTLLQATTSMERDAKNQVRRLVRQRIDSAAAGGLARESTELADDIRRRGISVTDSAGRQWNAESYASMVLRTLTGELEAAGTLQAAAQLGSPGVRIRDGQSGEQTDDECARSDGQAWSLEYYSTHMLSHPNCTRRATPLPLSYSGTLDRG